MKEGSRVRVAASIALHSSAPLQPPHWVKVPTGAAGTVTRIQPNSVPSIYVKFDTQQLFADKFVEGLWFQENELEELTAKARVLIITMILLDQESEENDQAVVNGIADFVYQNDYAYGGIDQEVEFWDEEQLKAKFDYTLEDIGAE